MDLSGSAVQLLVERAKEGSLSSQEVDVVAQNLTSGAALDSTYDLLYVLSRTRATRYESVVASFLDYSDDPMVARLALQTLCSFWGQSAKYLNELRRFAEGVEWDDSGDVRQVALSAAGEFLRESRDCELFRIVLDRCSGGADDKVEERIALEALARALGKPLAESLDMKRLDEWRPDLIADASSWLKANCSRPE